MECGYPRGNAGEGSRTLKISRTSTERLYLFCPPPQMEACDGPRTRDLDLGKVALYQLSYTRTSEASSGSRTRDLVLGKDALYQLSHACVIGGEGFEPPKCSRTAGLQPAAINHSATHQKGTATLFEGESRKRPALHSNRHGRARST